MNHNKWTPPPGTYQVEVLNVQDHPKTANGKSFISWNLSVLGGRYKGNEFPKYSNYITEKGKKQLAVDLAKCGVKRNDLASLVGMYLMVEVRASANPQYQPSVIIQSKIERIQTVPRSQVLTDYQLGRPPGVSDSEIKAAMQELNEIFEKANEARRKVNDMIIRFD